MEHYLVSVISLILCVYTYILGTRHGMSVSKGRVPQPIKEAVNSIKAVVQPANDAQSTAMQQIMSYDYETALKSVKKEQLEGKR